jgi:hypothetical protein
MQGISLRLGLSWFLATTVVVTLGWLALNYWMGPHITLPEGLVRRPLRPQRNPPSTKSSSTFPRNVQGIEAFQTQVSRINTNFSSVNIREIRVYFSMPEMPCAGEDHGHAALIGGSDDFFVAL